MTTSTTDLLKNAATSVAALRFTHRGRFRCAPHEVPMRLSNTTAGTLRRRHYREGDHVAVATIFTESIHRLTSEHYTRAQQEAWAPRPVDLEHWRWRCERKRPFLAVIDSVVDDGTNGTHGADVTDVTERIAAFLELDPDGHVDCAYTHPDCVRRGAMSFLLRHAVDIGRAQGLKRLTAEVSHTALPVFTHCGWHLEQVGPNVVARRGVMLENFLMAFTL